MLAGLTGVATGLALGTMATFTYDVIPEHARARLQTFRRIFGDGGAIADFATPSAVFWAFVPLQLAAALLITFVARESLHRVRGPEREPAPSV